LVPSHGRRRIRSAELRVGRNYAIALIVVIPLALLMVDGARTTHREQSADWRTGISAEVDGECSAGDPSRGDRGSDKAERSIGANGQVRRKHIFEACCLRTLRR
jgi:hypothetical protein